MDLGGATGYEMDMKMHGDGYGYGTLTSHHRRASDELDERH